MTDKILLVDDDPRILEGLKVALHRGFNLKTALGPEAGLEMLRSTGPYAVVVSDLKMPGMNGIEFLSRVREMSPHTVRVMLTGFADMDSAIAAVNTGEVFRFHTKPCPASVLRQTLRDALAKHQAAGMDGAKSSHGTDADPKHPARLLASLTARELRVVDLIRRNASSKEIAQIMNISTRTVESHRENIRRKLGLAGTRNNLYACLKSLSD